MSIKGLKINDEVIENFLNGSDPQKYIVSIEATPYDNEVSLIINDPNKGKYIEKHKFKPFLWLKHKVALQLYGGKRSEIKKAMKEYGVTIKPLTIENDEGYIPERLDKGFKYIAFCKTSYNNLIRFFKNGGVDIYSNNKERLFFTLTPVEQFLIQSGKRLFKGFDDYNDIHRLQFDLETKGLNPKTDRIFQIGVRDNRGFERVIEVESKLENEIKKDGREPTVDEKIIIEKELRESERNAIISFFDIIDSLKPDIITAYNSENFDWPFFYGRCEKLYIDISKIAKTLNPEKKIYRKKSTLKLGQETEYYDQTYMWGYNILDIIHSVRKAQSINSDIKSAGLKYITKFSKVAKKNRVYVDGDEIFNTWYSNDVFYFNDINGDWFKGEKSDEKIDKEKYVKTSGRYIVQRYLLDDLWETEQIDSIYNQANFLISKILPTSYMRCSTMGTAGIWKLIMSAWSYENNLAIPDYESKRDFTGGLSRLLEVGYAKNVVKLDYAALYPKTQLTHNIVPKLDISGAMLHILTYVVDKRDEFKFLKGEMGDLVKDMENKLKSLTDPEEKRKLLNEINKKKKLESDYDKKQLPLKILANSFFGSFGASYLFPWGEVDAAEETTCRGRQYLRLMVKHFTEKYGFRPLVGDSVTKDTPVYIRYKDNGLIDIKPICDLFDEVSMNIDGQERDFTIKNYEILTNNGWKQLDYVYRHRTNKKIYDIRTKIAHIRVTEDHSIFQNGKKVLPSTLKIGDEIDLVKLPISNSLDNMTLDKAWLLGFFIGDGSAIYGNRTQKYFSKRKNKIVIHKGKRTEWTLNNLNKKYLEKAQKILKYEFGVDATIKNYLKSSHTYKLKTHKVSISKWFSENCYTSYREKKVPLEILNSSDEIKISFLDGFICADGNGSSITENRNFYQKSITNVAGLTYLIKSLGLQYNISLRKYHYNKGLNGITINTPTKKIPCEDNKILWIEEFEYDDYVYDVSTEDGSFIGGIGGVSCSNTDGFNFAIPDNIDEIKYTVKANHWKTNKYKAGEILTGLEAVLAEFNEKYMIGRMGLDIDEICNSTINFSRKNYANDINGKIKFVGNTIKSKTMPAYIEEFLDKGIRLLLDGNGYNFIEYYYEYVNKIFNHEIPLSKIATKKRVKQSIDEYINVYCKSKTKNGNFKSRQAHMELILNNNLNVDLGDTIYYVNIGTSKSHGDIKTIKDKETGETKIELKCKLIPNSIIKNNPDLTTNEYNIPKYLDAFNKRIAKLLVCFKPEIRDKILIDVKKDRKTKELVLGERSYFTHKQCEMDSGNPFEPKDQDTYEDLMTMEDKEIRFWSSTNMVPNNMDEDEWKKIEYEWKQRELERKVNSINNEKEKIDDIFKRLEVEELNEIKTKGILPKTILSFADVGTDKKYGPSLFSIEWGVWLCKLEDIFKYEEIAIKRSEYYEKNKELFKNIPKGLTKYDVWKSEIEKIEYEEDFMVNPLNKKSIINNMGGEKNKIENNSNNIIN